MNALISLYLQTDINFRIVLLQSVRETKSGLDKCLYRKGQLNCGNIEFNILYFVIDVNEQSSRM